MNAKCGIEDVEIRMDAEPRDPLHGLLEEPRGWVVYQEDQEWFPTAADHPSVAFAKTLGPPLDFRTIPDNVHHVMVPVLYVQDTKGEVLRHVRNEVRYARAGYELTQEPPFHVFAPNYFIVNQPVTAALFEAGEYEAILHRPSNSTPLHRRIFLQARERLETQKALDAFAVLFKHYSFNEELWRLEKWVQEYLPFDLEEHEGMQRFRELLTAQVGHLRGVDEDVRRRHAHITPEGITQHYATTSPMAGVPDDYPELCKQTLPPRFKWLIDHCKAEGYTRVAEWGSVEGLSLFHLMHSAPDIAWYGFESKPEAVVRGRELGMKAGYTCAPEGCDAGPGAFHLNPMRTFRDGSFLPFDAVALFEVLEHNTPDGGANIVRDCLRALRVGGSLFISTPCGNWSGWDDHTRDLSLMKDHINAFTADRMRKFLSSSGPCFDWDLYDEIHAADYELVSCERVENPTLFENNQWCFAQVRRLK